MRIAILCLSTHKGGMELDAFRLALRLRERYRPLFVCRRNSFVFDVASTAGLDVCVVGGSEWFANKAISIALILNLRSRLIKNQISDLIFFGTSEARSIALAILGTKVRFYLRHGTTVGRAKHGGWWREFGYRRVDCYLACSMHIARNIEEFFPRSPTAEVRLLYPVLDPIEAGHREGYSREKIVRIFYHSRFVHGKGHLDAVFACDQLMRGGINFTYEMIGDLVDKELVRLLNESIHNYKLEDHCRVLPFDANVRQKLGSADVFLAPSYGEGFSNSLAEALGLGLVCLVYKNSVHPEFRRLGFYLKLIDHGNRDELASQLMVVCRDIEAERQRAKRNIELARKLFSSERELVDLINIVGLTPKAQSPL